MKSKKYLILVILFMTIGIAAVTTNVIINGTTPIAKNEGDYSVYFSNALVNGVQNTSIINSSGEAISFNSSFQAIGDTYKIDYTIANDSKNYDASVSVDCTEGDAYLEIVNTWDTSTNITAKKTKTGTLQLKLKKSYTGESEYSKTITCTLTTNAVERTTLGS